MNLLKRLVIAELRRRDIVLKDAKAEGWWPHKLQPLSDCKTVIDVGVWRGTPELYEAFPDAFLVLVDPLAEAEPHMHRIVEERPGVYETSAVGASSGTATLQVTVDSSASTLHDRTRPTPGMAVEQGETVPVERLDDIVARHEPPAPYLLKIDTEGHELEILKGSTATLAQTDCVIAELSVSDRFTDSYRLAEVVALLDDAGFALRDILEIKRGAGTFVRHFDGAFTRPSRSRSSGRSSPSHHCRRL